MFIMMRIINASLDLVGASIINNFDQVISWTLLLQVTLNLSILQHALCRYQDNEIELFKIVEQKKIKCGIDFLKFKQLSCNLRMPKHCLYQVQKPMASNAELAHRNHLISMNKKERVGQLKENWMCLRKTSFTSDMATKVKISSTIIMISVVQRTRRLMLMRLAH